MVFVRSAISNGVRKLRYEWFCDASPAVEEMEAAAFDDILQTKNISVIDVREKGELPEVAEFAHQNFPLSLLPERMPLIQEDTVVVFCQSGSRSKEAARLLSSTFGKTKKIYSLKGGIL